MGNTGLMASFAAFKASGVRAGQRERRGEALIAIRTAASRSLSSGERAGVRAGFRKTKRNLLFSLAPSINPNHFMNQYSKI